jgi:hypothetical protein
MRPPKTSSFKPSSVGSRCRNEPETM